MAQSETTVPILSNDALTVQILLQDLKRAGYAGHHPLTLIHRTRYLWDWTRERWDQARSELANVRRSDQSLPSDIDQMIDAMNPEVRVEKTII